MEKGSGRGPEEGTEIPDSLYSRTLLLFHQGGISANIPTISQGKDFYSILFRSILKVQHLDPGRLICLFSVIPAVANYYGGLHGGAVAAIVELVSIACARTVVDEDKELFLGELSMSYLSAAPTNAEVTVDASVVRSGRNVTVIAVEFKMKKTGKLAYTGRATFYSTPIAKL
ncbi:hypothetical protein VitviT2T_023614 [Vitis vinifera]|uniref:Thioesterase domain-containing protein n=2 Tax=Vitis vinifera TaxID=29760 RepID=A0ABY9DDI9_VITVI|nr:uncharacterized protein LOC100250507 [Vitis vinifera]WKA05662.1 hypothetical protein VitviT2T_023614 [Vitis vinifera]|eukprot:XP_002271066.1 PREDICTED: acyl-coenzyme A thioesterase 13 [Vitis vinifera]